MLNYAMSEFSVTSVRRSASSAWTFVRRDVLATLIKVSLSISLVTFSLSRTSRALSLAVSKPSAMILGWTPCSANKLNSEKSWTGQKYSSILFSSVQWHIECSTNLRDIKVCLFKKFSNDKYIGGGSIARDVILSCCYLCNQGCCWVLNLLKRHRNPFVILNTDHLKKRPKIAFLTEYIWHRSHTNPLDINPYSNKKTYNIIPWMNVTV